MSIFFKNEFVKTLQGPMTFLVEIQEREHLIGHTNPGGRGLTRQHDV